jgi:hypothetical protein
MIRVGKEQHGNVWEKDSVLVVLCPHLAPIEEVNI